MQRVPIQRLRPGMVTAANVFSADGRVLIRADVPITAQYINRLAQMGVVSLYVRTPFLEEECIPENIPETLRVTLVSELQRQFLAIQCGKPWDVQGFAEMAERIVTGINHPDDLMIQPTDIRLCNEFVFGHSVNVAVLCTLIGVAMGYPRHKLTEIALGGLLHDIGQMKIPPGLLYKSAKLSEVEYSIVQTHAMQGFELLRQSVAGIIPLSVMHMALQHHEKVNGTGYPRGLTTDKIHEYAKIAAVADVYDAATCDRPYRRANFPHEICLMMGKEIGRQFDVDILTAFLTRVAIYPIGSVVLLSTGHIGVVTQEHWNMQNRPTLRLFLGAGCRVLKRKEILDLREHPNIEIQQVLLDEEVFEVNELVRRQA